MYQPSSSSAISVTTFGARGDGASDDIAAIRAAVDSLQSRGLAGTIYFPRATYLFSGTVDVTGQNLTFFSDGGAVLKAFPDESAKKFNLSGAKNITFKGLTLDANRNTGDFQNNQNGFISTINVENLEVTDCDLFNCRNSMVYLGGGTRFARIVNNHFTGHFCGVYGYINSGEQFSEGFDISNNSFGASWIPYEGNPGESACIKLQTYPGPIENGGYTGITRGHTIANNTIDSTTQMGIELWSKGRGNTIAGNTITRTTWGISLDNQEYASVVGNTIKATQYIGIECASICRSVTIANNTIDGFLGVSGYTRYTSVGIISSNTTCDSIVHNGNLVMGCSVGFQIQNTTNTIISNNIIRDCNFNLFFQGASLSQVYGNLFERRNAEVAYQIFFDASSTDLSGFHLSHNKFRGATTNQSIFYYTALNPSRKISDLCVENNITDSSTSGGYGIFIGGQLTPTNFVYRTNFGPSGSDLSNSIPDATDPANPLPYGTTNLKAGIQYYGSLQYTIPTGGITGVGGNSGIWLCLWSGGGGIVNNVRLNTIYYNNLGNNSSAGMEIWASLEPYTLGRHALMVMPMGQFGQNLFSQVRTRSEYQPWGVGNEIWAKLEPTWTGSVGSSIYAYFSEQNAATSIYGTYTEPLWDYRGAVVYTDRSLQSLRLSDGVQISSGVYIYTNNGSDLVIDTSGAVTIPRLNFSVTGAALPNTLYTTGNQEVAGIKTFNSGNFTGNLGLGVSTPAAKLDIVGQSLFRNGSNSLGGGTYPYQMRFGYDGQDQYQQYIRTRHSNTRISNAFDFYTSDGNISSAFPTNEVLGLTITNGMIGVGTLSPGSNLHVSGSVCFSGIQTSTTANVGGASLPATAVGFITFNITGSNFKVPYYNV